MPCSRQNFPARKLHSSLSSFNNIHLWFNVLLTISIEKANLLPSDLSLGNSRAWLAQEPRKSHYNIHSRLKVVKRYSEMPISLKVLLNALEANLLLGKLPKEKRKVFKCGAAEVHYVTLGQHFPPFVGKPNIVPSTLVTKRARE